MIAVTKRLVLLIVVPVLFGHAFGACLATRSAAYGSELAECEQHATTWDDYTPCCTDVAHRYGRDPSFCWRDEDGRRR